MAKASPYFSGNGLHDPRQLRLVLETITTKAATLRDLLSQALMVGDESRGALVDAAFSQAQLIGLLADAASGMEAVGDPFDWTCGGNFACTPSDGAGAG